MAHEHNGHCCGHEVTQHHIQTIERLGALCCAGHCNHIEHQAATIQQNIWEQQMNAAQAEESKEHKSTKKKRGVRKGFMTSLLVPVTAREVT